MIAAPNDGANPGSAPVPRAGESVSLSRTSPGDSRDSASYYKRRLPHFERAWAIYAITISTCNRRRLSPASRTIVLNALRHFHNQRYELFAASIMSDHIYALLEPLPKSTHVDETSFWKLSELMHSRKSFTAHEINKIEGTSGQVWENGTCDRYVRSDRDLEETFHYILRNPWDTKIAQQNEDYLWIWTQEDERQIESRRGEAPRPACETHALPICTCRAS